MDVNPLRLRLASFSTHDPVGSTRLRLEGRDALGDPCVVDSADRACVSGDGGTGVHGRAMEPQQDGPQQAPASGLMARMNAPMILPSRGP